MFENLLTFENGAALIALTAMEIVLGIDNIIFIAIVTGRLPEAERDNARRIGLALALGLRIALLCSLWLIIRLEDPLFQLSSIVQGVGLQADWFLVESRAALNAVTIKDLILVGGGLFLIVKAVREIHKRIEGDEHGHDAPKTVTFGNVLVQIALLDVIFSLDSVITAVGMAEEIVVMVVAVILAVIVMLIFAGRVSNFVERHPTIKMLALSFLILIGVLLVADGIGTHIDKGYIYFAMTFALIVEVLNMRARTKKAKPIADPA